MFVCELRLQVLVPYFDLSLLRVLGIGLDSSCKAWWQASLPSELSHWPILGLKKVIKLFYFMCTDVLPECVFM